MRRRDFIKGITGLATSWSLVAHAQQSDGTRRVGVIMNLAADDDEGQARLAAFLQGLQEAGWSVGRNVRIDIRWSAGDRELYRRHAAELVALTPDVILASGANAVQAVQRASRSVPIVFANAVDPVGDGIVESLARPGNNATGFTIFELSMGGKWLELLMQIAPKVKRVAVIRDVSNPNGTGLFGAIQTVAPSFGVELRPVDVGEPDQIERAVTAFAHGANGGLVVTQNAAAIVHRKLIIALAARHRLPAVYAYRIFVMDGGLISYGPDTLDGFRRAAGYVDRILKGEKPADLPVQAPTKFETVINLKTAKAIDLDVPSSLLAHADEVIE